MSTEKSRARTTAAALFALVVVAGGFFSWGFLSHRQKVFPYELVKAAAKSLGLVDSPARRGKGAEHEGRKRLESLPYAERSYDPEGDRRGVILHDRSRAFQGLNFYTSADLPAAFLLDMEGRLLYQWRARGGKWLHATLLPTGEVLAVVRDHALHKVNADSEIVWTWKGPIHHDLWVDDDGRIFVLTNKVEKIPEIHPRRKIVHDFVTILSPDGEVLAEHSVHDLFRDSSYAHLLPAVEHRTWSEEKRKKPLDYFHTNHVEVLDGSLADRFRWYEDGLVLLSIRNLDTVAIADLREGEIVWAWGANSLRRQHHPTPLANGNLLIFDNRTENSVVLELDPRTYDVEWSYSDPGEFFSRTRGSNFRLPNGNTLITESDSGYVFEVTPEGEKVWVFANPRINEESERAAIWRLARFTPEELPFLRQVKLRHPLGS